MKLIPLLLSALLLAPALASAAAPEKPLNILILYADDWRFDTLGCAGNPVVQTPQLDQLAKEGMRFTHNCVTTSVCWVSRANLFTGQWMSRNGQPPSGMFKTPWAETYPGLLRARGYHTGHVGKWHNGTFPAEFAPLVADRRGDILALQGKTADAKVEYEKAYKGLDEKTEYRRLIEIKLNALGVNPVAPTVASAAAPAASAGSVQ